MEKIKVGSFVPLPVVPMVLVGAKVDGVPNYLAVGFVGGANIRPPILGISLNRKHHTVKGILENGTFSVNIPSADHVLETDYCGLVSGRKVDKSAIFSTFYGELETAPMIEELPLVCECRYTGQRVDFSMDTVFFGEVVQVYVNRALYRKGEPADILGINPLLTGLDRQYRLAGRPIGRTFSIGWEYPSKHGDSHDDEAEVACRIVEHPARQALFVHCPQQTASNQESIGNAFAEIAEYARRRGLSATDGPFIVHNDGLGPEERLDAGFVFESASPGQGRVESGTIVGGRFAECLHIGPYDTMGDTMLSLHAFVREHGFEAGGAVYEFYRNDPSATPPERLETLIAIPLEREE